ncbi:hypothetical protein DKX38_029280 [Salix brachista]|uniref:Pentacotripeptide-repeat region of PRORP domain-containing protein n=1 Tax=Salix brachista TaxID=2182728 RepID=A0A5N5J0C3_9ROSI|nr:hypothetical protein DKX38_029279 [Salix brachista]KAB5512252.1 hypothetical protein DKX38_029280 [Salix brachista]
MEPPSFERRGGNKGAQGWQDEDPLDDSASYAPMLLSEILQGEAGVTGESGRPSQTEGVPPVAPEQARILLSVHRVESVHESLDRRISSLEKLNKMKLHSLCKQQNKRLEMFYFSLMLWLQTCFSYKAVGFHMDLVSLLRIIMTPKSLRGFNVKPDVIVYGVLINAFADAESVKAALGYVDAMKRAGLPGNTVIYNSLIKLYTKVGYLKEAEETYQLLQLSDSEPEKKKKGNTNEFTFAMMLCMYKRLGRFEEATQIAKQMRDLRLLTDVLSYNNVLGLYALDGRFKEAVGIFKEMVEVSVQPDDCTFKSLGIVLVKCGITKKAVGKLGATTKIDYQKGLQAWVLSLSIVADVDDDYDE